MIDIVSITNFDATIIAFTSLAVVLGLNIGSGVLAFGLQFANTATMIVDSSTQRFLLLVCFAVCIDTLAYFFSVGVVAFAGAFVFLFFVERPNLPPIISVVFSSLFLVVLIPLATLLVQPFFVGGMENATGFGYLLFVCFVVGAIAFAYLFSVGNRLLGATRSAHRIQSVFSCFGAVEIFNRREFVFAASRTYFFFDAILIRFFGGAFRFFSDLSISGATDATSFGYTGFASRNQAIGTICAERKILSRRGFTLATLGASLLGNFCGMIRHSNGLLSAVAQAWDTSRVLPGTLYWSTPIIAQARGVSQ